MSLQEAGTDSPSKVFTARMKFGTYLPAQVMDAEMQVPIKQYEEVIAEPGPGKGKVTILWPFGEVSAKAVVPRNYLDR